MRYGTFLMLIGLLLSACNSDSAAPREATGVVSEPATREVYSLTIGDGVAGQEIGKRGIKKTAAISQQDVDGIQLDTETSILYINADRADLSALTENDFLKDAVDNFVPVIIEGEVSEKFDALLEEMFSFTLLGYDGAVISSAGEPGNYQVIPIGKANEINAILDVALLQSSRFRAANAADITDPTSTDPTSVENKSPEESITTQQSVNWVEGPNYNQTSQSEEKAWPIWTGTWNKCPPEDQVSSCSGTTEESRSVSHTWGWSSSLGISIKNGYAPTATGQVSTSYTKEYSVGRTTSGTQPVANGDWFRPSIEVPYVKRSGTITGKREVEVVKSEGPRGENITETEVRDVNGTYEGTYETDKPFYTLEVRDTAPF